MEVDIIIVGNGIAGACCAQILLEQNKEIVVFNKPNKQTASQVAAGLVNPVILKRFTPIWKAMEQMEITQNHFPKDHNIINFIPLYRIFNDENEIKTWKNKAQLPQLNQWLNPNIIKNETPEIKANLGLGKVNDTARIDFKNYINWIKNRIPSNRYFETSFRYNELKKEGEHWIYQEIKAKYIIFAEGMAASENPFFPKDALIGNKGQVLEIKTSVSLEPRVYKSKVFLAPLSNDTYYVGATYERNFENSDTSEEGRNQLINGLTHFFSAPYQVVRQLSGIRPTTKDRRPIIGEIPNHSNLYVINGLGTRGALLGPYAAQYLVKQIFENKEPHPDMDINRFYD